MCINAAVDIAAAAVVVAAPVDRFYCRLNRDEQQPRQPQQRRYVYTRRFDYLHLRSATGLLSKRSTTTTTTQRQQWHADNNDRHDSGDNNDDDENVYDDIFESPSALTLMLLPRAYLFMLCVNASDRSLVFEFCDRGRTAIDRFAHAVVSVCVCVDVLGSDREARSISGARALHTDSICANRLRACAELKQKVANREYYTIE